MNEPNRYIKNMFEGLDKINQTGLRNTSFFADRSLFPPEFPPPINPTTSGWTESMGSPGIDPRMVSSGMLPDEITRPFTPYAEPFTPGVSTPPQGIVGNPSIKGTPAPPGGQYPANFVQGGISPTTSFAPGARKADQTVYLPKYSPPTEAAPMPLLTEQNRLSHVLTQIPNHGRANNIFDKRIDWLNPKGGK